MPWTVILQDWLVFRELSEVPEKLEDEPLTSEDCVLLGFDRLPTGNSGFPILGFIDPDDDCAFSGFQMLPFLSEWDRVQSKFANDPRLWERVRALAQKCYDNRNDLYLKFIGG